jgi:hypothetical protein
MKNKKIIIIKIRKNEGKKKKMNKKEKIRKEKRNEKEKNKNAPRFFLASFKS